MSRSARGLWSLVAVVAAIGSASAGVFAQSRIDRAASNLTVLAAQLDATLRLVAARRSVDDARAVLTARLRRPGAPSASDEMVARFLRDASASAERHRTAIAGVAAPGTPAVAPHDGFESVPLELTLDGRYADVLAMMRDISAGTVPARVELVTLAHKGAGPDGTTLEATLRADLIRLAKLDAPAAPASP